jgi:hypothetical protein
VHLTPFRRLPHEYVPHPSGEYIQYGGNERSPILGIGTFVLRVVVNGEVKLHLIPNVRQVKHARSTLIAARQLLRQTGFRLEATHSWAHLSMDGRVQIPRRFLAKDFFCIQGSLVPAPDSMHSAMQATVDSCMLWHEPLAHPGEHVVTVLQRRDVVQPNANRGPSHIGACESCALGKGKRTPRHSRNLSTPCPTLGAILHAGLCFQRGMHPDCLLTVVIKPVVLRSLAFNVACILIVF